MIKPLKEFARLDDYKKIFSIDENSIFAYKGNIYCDKKVPPDIVIHELRHIKRQNKLGSDIWVKKYLEDKDFRLHEEVVAYKAQLNFIKERNIRNLCRLECVKNLTEIYKLDITGLEAFKLLK